MKHIKSMIIIFIILIIIASLCIYVLNNNETTQQNNLENEDNTYDESTSDENNDNKEDNEDNEVREIGENDDRLYSDTRIKELDSESMLLTIQSCINTYLNYNYSTENEAVCGLLDSDYMTEYNITKDNVFEKVEKIEQKTHLFIAKVYEKEITFGYEYKYFVYGIYYNSEYENLGERYFEINLDKMNFTFKINPFGEITEEEYNKKMSELIENDTGTVIVPDNIETMSIEKNNYNTFEIKGITNLNDLVMNYYFNYYRFLIMNDSNKAYELLDENYKKNNYSNYAKFEQFCRAKLAEVTDASIVKSKSKKEYLNGYERYTIIDNYGNYFIFDIKAPMNFTVSLSL